MLTNVVHWLIFWICAAIAGKYLPNAVHSQITKSGVTHISLVQSKEEL